MEDKQLKFMNYDDEELMKMRQKVLLWIENRERQTELKKTKSIVPDHIALKPKNVKIPADKKNEKGLPILPRASISRNKSNIAKSRNKIYNTLFDPLRIAALIFVVFFIFLVAFFYGLYNFYWKNDVVFFITKILPIPAAQVGDHSISYSEYLVYYKAIEKHERRYMERLEMRSYAMEKLIQREVSNIIADKYDISIS